MELEQKKFEAEQELAKARCELEQKKFEADEGVKKAKR